MGYREVGLYGDTGGSLLRDTANRQCRNEYLNSKAGRAEYGDEV